jgi:1-pyrroline-4-hydroxy-2-carboxylate deaminase
VAYYRDLGDSVDAPVMIYNWPHGCGVDIDADLADRLVEIDNVVAIKDSTPDFAQFAETTRRIVDRARVIGPFMSVAGLDLLLEVGGDGFIGGGSLWGARDAEFWEAVWRGDIDSAREHARRTDELFPKLWLPGGWGGHYGAYQSQLKVLMQLLGQPIGTTVRPPRLPVTDEASIAAMREILIEAGLLAQPAEVA